MLRLNNTPIWNMTDLKREFNPIHLYNCREEFERFANVHCMVLSSKLANGSDEACDAYYLTKDFWREILKSEPETEKEAKACLWEFLNKKIEEELGDSQNEAQLNKLRNEIEKEISISKLDEKIEHIVKSIKATNEFSVVHLLAICEISETDARDYEFDVPKENTSASLEDQQSDITTFDICGCASNVIRTVKLKASKYPYKYYIYEKDSLNDTDFINTVKLEAITDINKYNHVTVEFYNSNKSFVGKISIKPGEHRFVTIADGKLIRILPAISISNGCCVFRGGYSSDIVKIQKGILPPRAIAKFKPESFVALNEKNGVVLVCDGSVITNHCSVESDYRTRLILDTTLVKLNVVEINNNGEAIKVLTTDGKVRRIMSCVNGNYVWDIGKPCEERRTSLTKANFFDEVNKKSGEILEEVFSPDRTESALLLYSGECRIKNN